MNLLTMENISKSYTDRMLLINESLGINDYDRIGIIGINGTGKSTLLKIIAGIEEADSGTITKGKKIRIEYLPQVPEFNDELSLLENVIQGKTAEESYRNLEGEAKSMLIKLGLSNYDESPKILSGGQKKRAALVRTLLTPADILVLDEPTNHLDNEMVEWLEDYLNKYRGAFVMITHDRYFLDKVTNRIVEIDKGHLYSYQANYLKFLELKAAREEIEMATERKNKSLYRVELEWMMRGAKARSTKQKAHIERFEKLRDRAAIEEDKSVEISSVSSRLGKKTIELDHVFKQFDDKTYIDDFSYIFLPGDRIGIIGPNGCGKSTLLKIITNQLLPDKGEVHTGSTVKIGYFSQENEALNEQQKVIDYVKDTAEFIQTVDGVVTASQMCEKFLFTGAMQYSLISKLSGGEKRRLYLLKVLMEAPNVLILDEPTNDLDIQTLNILEAYLENFDGIVITVSHDRYFLDKVVDRIFSFEGNGSIVQYEGSFSDYKEKRESKETYPLPGDEKSSSIHNKASDSKSSVDNDSSKNTWKQPNNRPKFSYNEQKEYESIDDDIHKLEQTIANLEVQISKSATEYSKLNALMEEKEQYEQKLEEKMERWMYLNDIAEQIEAYKQNAKL